LKTNIRAERNKKKVDKYYTKLQSKWCKKFKFNASWEHAFLFYWETYIYSQNNSKSERSL